MADTKTSAETAATALDGTELVRIVQSSSSKKTTAAVLAKQYRGARAQMTADDTAQNVTTEGDISFDQATGPDAASLWSAGTPARLTVAAGLGITHVKLVGQAYITSSTGDTSTVLRIRHRNSSGTDLGFYGFFFVEFGTTGHSLNCSTGVLAVDDGDYFTLSVREETDTSVTIEGNDNMKTFLDLEIVGMEPV